MELNEYFGDWLKVIEEKELFDIVRRVSQMYKHFPVNPDYGDIFKVFRVCNYDNCKAVFLLQD